MQTPPWIFISYRRERNGHWVAGRLCAALEERLGAACAFYDSGALEPGIEWSRAILRALADCLVVVVLIGPDWSPARLETSNDWVRREVAEAIKRGKILIPLLVDGAGMPSRGELPSDMEPLANWQACLLDGRSELLFQASLTSLVGAIQSKLMTELFVVREKQSWWKSLERNRWLVFLDDRRLLELSGDELSASSKVFSGRHTISVAWDEKAFNGLLGEGQIDYGYSSSGSTTLQVDLLPGRSIFTLEMGVDSRSAWRQFVSGWFNRDERSRSLVLRSLEPPNWQHMVASPAPFSGPK